MTDETKPQVGEEAHDSILKQVEFYFSDQNLPKDKFLYKTTQLNDGWVPIATIAQFKRMREFRPVDQIVAALKKSPELLEVSEDNENVRRKLPLVEPKKEEKMNAFARSVYAKGFPDETDTLQVELEKFFSQYGETKEVRMRRTDDKKFKNSVFVEFAKMEDAEKFLAADPKPKFGDNELLTMSKKAYVDMKAAEHGFTQNANGKRKRFNAFNDGKKGAGSKKQRFNKRDGKRDGFQKKGGDEPKEDSKTESKEPKEESKEAEAKEESKAESKEESKPEAKEESSESKPETAEATESTA